MWLLTTLDYPACSALRGLLCRADMQNSTAALSFLKMLEGSDETQDKDFDLTEWRARSGIS